MKTGFFRRHVLGTAIAVLCLIGNRSPQISNAQAQPAPPPDNSTESGALPPTIYPNSPLAQVVKLVQAGVEENVIMTFVTNSSGTFNLDSDKIIYLKDIGTPGDIVTAMIQRDQVLQQQMATAPPPPEQPVPTPEAGAVSTTEPVPPPQPVEVTQNYFYDTLAPYGSWMEVDGYGRCWRPTVVVVNSGWQPYCDHGHWVYTDCGWYWISDYSWGWSTFHYGRWFHHARWGWCWWPDTVWAPSWVCWRHSNEYCGWAPLPPFTTCVSGIGFTYRGIAVGVGFDFGLNVNAFTFVPIRNFCDPHPHRHRVDPREMNRIYHQTTAINNINVDSHRRTLINSGIAPENITAVTRTEIHPVTIHDAGGTMARGGHGEQLGHDGHTLVVNRPHFTENPAWGRTPINRDSTPPVAPPRVETPAQNHSAPENYNRGTTRMPRQPSQGPRNTVQGPPNLNQAQAQGQFVPANNHPSSPAAPAEQTSPRSYERRTMSPRGQQIEQQTPRVTIPNPQPNQNTTVPVERPQHNPPPAERPQHNESRPNYSEPAPRNAPPSAPPSSAPSQSSNKSDKSDKQDKDQNGPGNGPRH
jgi:hypothetical protein